MLENKEGQKIPEIEFKIREGVDWKTVSTKDLFDGKKVAVFSLPGAFTPTCSTSHLPRYNELFPVFQQNGIDSILCVSVNDTFVMNAWQKDQNAPNITMIPDGNGDFTDAMGMLVEKNGIGFGKRSWRYSMIVDNGVVEKMFIEPQKDGDPYEVSDADTMLKYLNPNAKGQESVVLFTKENCPFCLKAKDLLSSKGMAFEEVIVDKAVPSRILTALSGKTSVPQIFIGGKLIGGSDDLESYFTN